MVRSVVLSEDVSADFPGFARS